MHEPDTARRIIEDFVDEILDPLDLPTSLRDEARTDFIAHLDADVHRLIGRGVPPHRAVAEAIRSFGEAREIGSLLALASRRDHGSRSRPSAMRGRGRVAHAGSHVRLLLESVGEDMRYGVRGLLGSPVFGLAAVLTIALGVGASAAVFSIVDRVLLRPLSYPAPQELVRVWPIKRFSEPMLAELRARVTRLSSITSCHNVELPLTGQDEPTIVSGLIVPTNHFDTVGVAPALGRGFVASDQLAGNEAVAIVSHELWRDRLGADPDVVGTNIDLGGAGYGTRRVVGVMPAGYRPLSPGVDAWLPLATDPESPAYLARYANWVVGRLAPGFSVQEASAEIRTLVPDFAAKYPIQFRPARRSPVAVVPFFDTLVGGVRNKLLLLFGAVSVLLLIACSNVANLLLARSTARNHEVAIRMALGAERGRLLRQLLTESSVIGILGGFAGLALGQVTLAGLRHSIPSYIPRTEHLGLDWRVFGFALAASVLAGLAFGVAPALAASRSDPRRVIEGTRGATPDRRRHLINNALVVVQIALAMVLVIAASLLLANLYRISRVDGGFDVEQLTVMHVELPERGYGDTNSRREYFQSLIESVRAIHGVDVVGAINRLPLTDGNFGIPFEPIGAPLPEDGASLVANARFVTSDYFRAVGMQLLEGRVIQDADSSDARLVAMVNNEFARRHWSRGSPVGEAIRIRSGTEADVVLNIVGVVSDVRQHHLGQDSSPEIYLPAGQWNWPLRYIAARHQPTSSAILADLRTAVVKLDPDVPVAGIWPMREVVGDSLRDSRFYTRIFSVFAAVATLLGTVGTYALVAYTTAQRTRETGLRLALGAQPGAVLRRVIVRGGAPVLIGTWCGTVLALAITRLMAGMLYGVSPFEPAVFVSVGTLLLLTGLIACYVPARRASRIDPVVALTAE